LSVGTYRVNILPALQPSCKRLLSLDKPGAMRRVRVLTGSQIYWRSGVADCVRPAWA
jgi:hypothetical protein